MKKVLVISTGGTISCITTSDGLAPKLNGNEILDATGGNRDFELTFESISSIDSTDISVKIWEKLILSVHRGIKNYDGILILHGTDTMEYTTALISNLFSDSPIPIVFTGSMLPLDDENTDAGENINDSLTLISNTVKGVYLVFGGKLIYGDRTMKMLTDNPVAFESADRNYAGSFMDGKLYRNDHCREIPRKSLAIPDSLRAKVMFIKLTPNTDSSIFNYLIEQGYEGCVLSGFGAGGIPQKHTSLINEALENGIIFVMNSQCAFGEICFNKYLTGLKAKSLGILSADNMTDACALTRLMVILSLTKDIHQIKELY